MLEICLHSFPWLWSLFVSAYSVPLNSLMKYVTTSQGNMISKNLLSIRTYLRALICSQESHLGSMAELGQVTAPCWACFVQNRNGRMVGLINFKFKLCASLNSQYTFLGLFFLTLHLWNWFASHNQWHVKVQLATFSLCCWCIKWQRHAMDGIWSLMNYVAPNVPSFLWSCEWNEGTRLHSEFRLLALKIMVNCI